ncbi:MAG: hypothetical protein ACOC8K_08930 [Gemmatimonadota bacterium]
MNQELKDRADARFEAALEAAGARDPRDYYRDVLRELKGRDPDAYEAAVEHFQETLIPGIASGELQPLEAWREYGRKLAERVAEGRTVEIDATGLSHPHDPSAHQDRLVVHLPDDTGEKAILVSLPAEVTPAQQATYDLLVAGKQTLGG